MKKQLLITKGFTLIELLIVIAVLGILAAVVLVAIDPVEQVARGRDAARKNIVTQLGRAIEVYKTTQGLYPGHAVIANWVDNMLATGDIRTTPSSSTNVPTPCSGGIPNNKPSGTQICYKLDTTASTDHKFTIFMKSESRTEANKPGCTAATSWLAYLSVYGKGGSFCKTPGGEPVPAETTNYFVE